MLVVVNAKEKADFRGGRLKYLVTYSTGDAEAMTVMDMGMCGHEFPL